MSFSIPTLRAYRIITTGGIIPADPVLTSIGVGCSFSSKVLNGFISTSTVGASLVYTIDTSDPVYGSNGTIIPCQTGYFVNTTPANSCEKQNIGVAICPSSTTIKAIAYLNGQSSNVVSTTRCATCPGSLTAPTITPSCPNGGTSACNNGIIAFTVSAGSQCGQIYYTVQQGSPPSDPTSASSTITSGTSYIFTGTTPGVNIPVYFKAILIDSSCGLSSSVNTTGFGYNYP